MREREKDLFHIFFLESEKESQKQSALKRNIVDKGKKKKRETNRKVRMNRNRRITKKRNWDSKTQSVNLAQKETKKWNIRKIIR